MHAFAPLLCVLLLAGCDGGAERIVHRNRADGRDLIHSRIQVHGGTARFDCIASASGRCHYALLAKDCAPGGRCSGAVRRLEIGAGRHASLSGLPTFDACVGEDAPPTFPCDIGRRDGRTAAFGPLRLHWKLSYDITLPVLGRLHSGH